MHQELAIPAPRYVVICKLSDLDERQVARVAVPAGDLLVIRIRGEVYAIANRCSHMAKPLFGGRLHGYHIVCPFHSAQFDVRNGKSNGFPATRPIQTYDVKVEGNDVLVALPEEQG